jgi:AraC-like DNA-binding protein
MYSDPATQVVDVAYLLGYTTLANFARGLRRIGVVGPKAYLTGTFDTAFRSSLSALGRIRGFCSSRTNA